MATWAALFIFFLLFLLLPRHQLLDLRLVQSHDFHRGERFVFSGLHFCIHFFGDLFKKGRLLCNNRDDLLPLLCWQSLELLLQHLLHEKFFDHFGGV